MHNYRGIIIEESLENRAILKRVKILSTRVENVTEKHKTPWVSQWTMHTVEVSEAKAGEIADEIKRSLDHKHSWYADFKNKIHHYIIFRDKVFSIDRKSKEQYDKVKRHGISLGIPEYQLDFAPDNAVWQR